MNRIKKIHLYRILNKINGKIYIGQTSVGEKRWQNHVNAARKGSTTYLCNAIRKHGVDNFIFEILFHVNSTDEADFEETRRKLSIIGKGRKLSKETRLRMAAGQRKRRVNETNSEITHSVPV